MISSNIKNDLVLDTRLVNVDQLLPHEEVVSDRLITLVDYLKTLKPYIIVPSILVCDKTNMIVDGHHRFYALQKLNFTKVPVTYIDYASDKIVADLEGKVLKGDLIIAAKNGKVLSPKTSFHHVLDEDLHFQPLILLSVLTRIDWV
jgi:hypothetical protein